MKKKMQKIIPAQTAPILVIVFALAMLIGGGFYVWAQVAPNIPGAEGWATLRNGVQPSAPLTAAKWNGLVNKVASVEQTVNNMSCTVVSQNVAGDDGQLVECPITHPLALRCGASGATWDINGYGINSVGANSHVDNTGVPTGPFWTTMGCAADCDGDHCANITLHVQCCNLAPFPSIPFPDIP